VSDDPSKADYWNQLYLTGEAGWDKGTPSPPIARMMREGRLARGSKVAVIGAGKGHEAKLGASLGFEVSAVDFAPEAVKALRAAGGFEVLERDLFDLPRTHSGVFDAVLEHTCFCAIPVSKRDEYVQTVAKLLKPGGWLFGLFYATGKEGGPPFATTEAEVRQRFEKDFSIVKLATAPDSFEARAGREIEAWLQKSGRS
jgi:SAM-dependent methyltransferase